MKAPVSTKILPALVILLMSTTQAWTDQILTGRVVDELEKRQWTLQDAAAIATAQELSFSLHDANGTLEDRLDRLGRYSGNPQLQILIARHPAWMDFFLDLAEPDAFAASLDSFSSDQRRREALLEALLSNPDPAGYRQFERVVIRYGDVLGHLADLPEFGTLISVLVILAREGTTPDFDQWLHELLGQMAAPDIEPVTVMLAGHGGLLRHEVAITPRWRILSKATAGNPLLRDLLLEHLGIWQQLDDADLIDAIRSQLASYGRDQAQLYLAFLLGRTGILGEANLPETWRDPLAENRIEWAVKQMKHTPSSPAIEAALHFRESEEFWTFVMKPQVAERIPCLLSKNESKVDKLTTYFSWDATQIDGICGGVLPESLPFASLERLGRKAWHGTPIEFGDVGAVVLDLATITPALRIGKIVIPAAKGTVFSARATRSVKVGKTLAGGDKVLSSAVRANILDTNIARRAVAASPPGLSRMLGDRGITTLAARASKAVEHAPPGLKVAINEALWVGGDTLLENALTTEFVRCTGIQTLSVDDDICRTLFPPALQDEIAQ